jgi:DNA-binding SARP family transcriptional activator
LRDARGAGEGRAAKPDAPRVVPAKIRVPLPVQAPLPRERIEARLAEAFGKRLTLVVAPAGSGKTTLLARFATSSGAAVAWYRAESWDADEASFVRHLEAALAHAVPGIRGRWTSVEDAARDLEAAAGTRHGSVLLVIDDFYYLEDTAAEAAFGRFVDYAPSWLTLVVATRVAPGLNLSRLRLADELLEVSTDDLRFRAWEVEQLFRDVYHDPVGPADLAVLARRTEGWAAGLQLFHLATRGRSPEERRRVLGGPGSSGRLLREYLAQNVMAGLPVELQVFLLDTCVLGRLSGVLCDRIRGAAGSRALLDELARRGVFTVPVEDGTDAYRYHEILRQHLDRVLVEEIGEAAARERHGRAGRLLEDEGAYAEALRAYSRAEDWTAVRRLLGGEGERLAASREGRWIEELPPAIERHDPWVALAAARRARNDGRWASALAAYAHAEAGLGPARSAEAPRTERLALAAWLDPAAMPPADASGALRAGLVRDPSHAARDLARRPVPAAPVARGLLLLAAGEVLAARRVLDEAADLADGGAFSSAAARLGATVATVLAGEVAGPRAFDRAVEEAEHAGAAWLARLGRTLGELMGGTTDAEPETTLGDRVGFGLEDAWGAALTQLAAAWGGAGGPDASLLAAESAADAFRRLGTGVPEAWARGIAALAAAHGALPDAREDAASAESLARATGTQAVRQLAHAALALVDPVRATDHRQLERATAAETGLVLPAWARHAGAAGGDRVPEGSASVSLVPVVVAEDGRLRRSSGAVRIRTFGGFVLEVGGRPVPLDGVKPRVRSLLRLLAVHVGAPVHREAIQEALWPDADAAAGARSLHVALSALRRLLDDVADPPGGRLIARDGDAYRLAVDADEVDLGRFDRALAAGRTVRARGEASAEAFATAVDLYTGELLPEEGPAEWVGERREEYQARAIEAATSLAEESLLVEDLATAVRACRFGLGQDRYQDALWRMLISARERGGEAGAASRERREYAQVLRDLGVASEVAAGAS